MDQSRLNLIDQLQYLKRNIQQGHIEQALQEIDLLLDSLEDQSQSQPIHNSRDTFRGPFNGLDLRTYRNQLQDKSIIEPKPLTRTRISPNLPSESRAPRRIRRSKPKPKEDFITGYNQIWEKEVIDEQDLTGLGGGPGPWSYEYWTSDYYYL